MQVMLYRVKREPELIEIKTEMELQDIVGGFYEKITLANGYVLVCNEDAKMLRLPPNRMVIGKRGFEAIDGDFCVCKKKGNNVTGLSKNDIEKVKSTKMLMFAN